MFTSNFEVPPIAYDMSETLGKWAEQQREELLVERKGVSKKRVKVTFEPLPMETKIAGMAIAAEHKLRSAVVKELLTSLKSGIAMAATGDLRQRNLMALHNAIMDSGASGIYVSKDVQLQNVQPGRGHVSVANGVREPIVETGDLGPLRGAQKVNSFNRTLIGVYALAKRFGGVFFGDRGVFVTSAPGAKKLQMTKIGDMPQPRGSIHLTWLPLSNMFER